jgi:small GTP-binding protein
MEKVENSVKQNDESESNNELNFKMIVLGDPGVGKSCLTSRATKDVFSEEYAATLGFEFLTFNAKIEDKNIKLQIWDTCGQEMYKSLISNFYRNASLAMLVYAIDDKNSFINVTKWIKEIKLQSSPDIKMILIGNKADLENKRKVTKDMAHEFADTNKIKLFLETSAKTGFNAQNIFIEAAKLLYEQHLKFKDRVSRPESVASVVARDSTQSATLNIMNNEEENENVRKKWRCCK